MGWLTADARPSLVKAIVALEPMGPPFLVDPDLGVSLEWGLAASPMTFDPPASSPDELEKAQVGEWTLQAEPAPRLPALADIPIAILESEASLFAYSCPATAAFLEQAGRRVDRIVLAEHGVHGNGHLMLLERNNREALEPILRWLDACVPFGWSRRIVGADRGRRANAAEPFGHVCRARRITGAQPLQSISGARSPVSTSP